jgi:CheY-like chemotaxis protein/HPt (histidine-containing phosphotransfer) domain-containing protein
LLERLGYVGTVVGDGIAALEELDRQRYDAVLMDCQMPRMDGYETTKEIRRREGHRHTPIIAMTASAMAAERDHCLEVGMDDHLPKPVRRDELAAALQRWLVPGTNTAVPEPVADDEVDRVDEELLSEFLEMVLDAPGGEPPPVLDMFLTEASSRLERIRSGLAGGDLSEAARAAHSLKGSSGAFGARRLSALGAKVEVACKEGDPEAAADLLPALESESEAFRAILGSRLSERASAAGGR